MPIIVEPMFSEETVIAVHFFFFLNQQFIMQGAKAGHGNYLVATYIDG